MKQSKHFREKITIDLICLFSAMIPSFSWPVIHLKVRSHGVAAVTGFFLQQVKLSCEHFQRQRKEKHKKNAVVTTQCEWTFTLFWSLDNLRHKK